MIQHTPPPNWVAERAKCNLDLTFAALYDVVKRDVDEMNKLSDKQRRGYSFSLEQNGEGTNPRIRVRRFPENDPDSNESIDVTFEKSIRAIRIDRPPNTTALAFPCWHEKTTSCHLKINGRNYKLWELSQWVLEPLFFEI